MSAPSCFALDFAYASCVVEFVFDAFCVCETLPPYASPVVAPGLCSGLHGCCHVGLLPYDGFSHGFVGFGCLQQLPPVVASPVVASPPTPFWNCSFDWPVEFLLPAQASPELLVFDCSTPPDLQARATQTGTATFTGAICFASDFAEAFCVVEFEFDASCDCVTSPP